MTKLSHTSTLWLAHLHLVLLAALVSSGSSGRHGRRGRNERGDVPGWVMITMMSAGVVAILTPLIGRELKAMLQSALNSVK